MSRERYKAVIYDQAGRGIDEMAEMLRRQILAEAAALVEAAKNPLTAGYMSGRTSQLHEWATQLATLRSIKDGWFREPEAPHP